MDEMFAVGLFWGAVTAFIVSGLYNHRQSIKTIREKVEQDREERLSKLERMLCSKSFVTKEEFRELQLEVKRNAEGW